MINCYKQVAFFFFFIFSVPFVKGQQGMILQERINPVFPLAILEMPGHFLFQDTHTGKVLKQINNPGGQLGALLSFSPNGKFCIISGNGKETTIYAIDGSSIKEVANFPFRTLFSAFNPIDEEVVLVHSRSIFKAKLTRYSLANGQFERTRSIAADINSVGISADGAVIGFSNNRLVQFLDYKTFEKSGVHWEREKQSLVTFNPQVQQLASVADKHSIQLRNFEDELLDEINAHSSKVVWLSFDRSGRRLASLDQEGHLFIWDVAQKTLIRTFDHVYQMPSFNPANALLLRQSNSWVPIDLNDAPGTVATQYFEKDKERRFKILPSPVFGYTRETGLTLGASTTMIWYPKTNSNSRFSQPSVFVPSFAYGFNGKQFAVGAYMEAYYQNKWYFNNTFSFTHNGKNYFFGVAEESARENKTTYVSDHIIVDGSISRLLSDRFSVGLGYKLRNNSELDFERATSLPFYGEDGGWLLGIGPKLRMDKRDNLIFPNKGSMLEINYYLFHKWISNYKYHEIKLDYRKYFPVNWLVKGDVFAFQAMFNGTWGGDVPFYQLPYLSADRALRGVYHNLYIANQVYSVQAEFRSFFSDVDQRFGYAVFAGLGDASDNFFKDYKAHIKTFYGAGFRQQLMPKFRLDTRLDFGFTNKGDFGVFVGTGVAF